MLPYSMCKLMLRAFTVIHALCGRDFATRVHVTQTLRRGPYVASLSGKVPLVSGVWNFHFTSTRVFNARLKTRVL